MKITSLVASGVLEFNDLGSVIKGVSPILRSVRLNPGATLYLVETGEVLLSAQSGDIYRFKTANKISVNDRVLALGAGLGVTLIHNFGFLPKVTVVKDPTGTPTVATTAEVTVTHNTAYTQTIVTNITGGPLNFDIRLS